MEAGMFAIRDNSEEVKVSHFKRAIAKVMKTSKKTHDKFEMYA